MQFFKRAKIFSKFTKMDASILNFSRFLSGGFEEKY